MSVLVLLIISAYLIGSIPSSVWIGRMFYGLDIREHGSGNAGTTNTFRVLGVRAGIAVFIVDALKGWFAVYLIHFTNYFIPGSNPYVTMAIFLGVASVIGHIFPIYVGFKGGKGVATLFGVVIGIHAQAALIALGVFIIILLISRYVSLSSIIAGISFPVVTIAIFKTTLLSLIIFSIVISLLLLITHQHNIIRLIKHEESKANLFRKKKKKKGSLK